MNIKYIKELGTGFSETVYLVKIKNKNILHNIDKIIYFINIVRYNNY